MFTEIKIVHNDDGQGHSLSIEVLQLFLEDKGLPLAILHEESYNLNMKKTLRKQLFVSMKNAEEKLSKLTLTQKKDLEKSWDIEHAYYSSALEGSKIDRTEFEKLGKKVS